MRPKYDFQVGFLVNNIKKFTKGALYYFLSNRFFWVGQSNKKLQINDDMRKLALAPHSTSIFKNVV